MRSLQDRRVLVPSRHHAVVGLDRAEHTLLRTDPRNTKPTREHPRPQHGQRDPRREGLEERANVERGRARKARRVRPARVVGSEGLPARRDTRSSPITPVIAPASRIRDGVREFTAMALPTHADALAAVGSSNAFAAARSNPRDRS